MAYAGFDLKKTYDDDFSPITEGWHMVQVNRAILGESKKGEPQIQLQYRMLSPHADRGKTCRDYINLVDAPWGYARLAQVCLAIDPNMSGSANSSDGFDPHNQQSIFNHVLGGILNVYIKHTTGEGRDGVERTYANADKHGYAKPQKRQAVFAELGGEPKLDDDAYCDFDGIPLNDGQRSLDVPSQGFKEDPRADEDHWDNPEIPF